MDYEHETSERGEINEGFWERRDMLNAKAERRNTHQFYSDKPVKVSLSATRGHDIRNWTTEKTQEMRPGDTMIFESGGDEFRLKLLGVEEYRARGEFRPEGYQPRVAIDRFDPTAEEWVEYVEKGGPEGCYVSIDLSYSIDVEPIDEN